MSCCGLNDSPIFRPCIYLLNNFSLFTEHNNTVHVHTPWHKGFISTTFPLISTFSHTSSKALGPHKGIYLQDTLIHSSHLSLIHQKKIQLIPRQQQFLRNIVVYLAHMLLGVHSSYLQQPPHLYHMSQNLCCCRFIPNQLLK